MEQTLADLMSAVPFDFVAATSNPTITAPVVEDARLVEPGGVFLARRGRSPDGHQLAYSDRHGLVVVDFPVDGDR